MKPEIIEKLGKFLKAHVPVKEECEVVYLMVEIRKLLYREGYIGRSAGSGPFALVHFYCDWTVHTDKDNITPCIEQILRRIDDALASDGEASSKDDRLGFLSMSELKEGIHNFFERYDLPANLCSDEENWKHFVDLFVQVLADQPIKIKGGHHSLNISSFRYLPSNGGKRVVEITFADQSSRLIEDGL